MIVQTSKTDIIVLRNQLNQQDPVAVQNLFSKTNISSLGYSTKNMSLSYVICVYYIENNILKFHTKIIQILVLVIYNGNLDYYIIIMSWLSGTGKKSQ